MLLTRSTSLPVVRMGGFAFVLACVCLPLAQGGQLPAETPVGDTSAGVYFRQYNVNNAGWVSALVGQTPAREGIINNFVLEAAPPRPNDNFGYTYRGYINCPADGTYTFYTNSDDGSIVYIGPGDQIVANYDGPHGMGGPVSGTIDLQAGKHAIRVDFIEAGGGEGLFVEWECVAAGVVRQEIPVGVLTTEPAPAVTPVITGNPINNLVPNTVTITCTTGAATIYYTTDGSLPTRLSPLFGASPVTFTVLATTTVRAIAYGGGFSQSGEASAFFQAPLAAENPTLDLPGLYYEYYEIAGGLTTDIVGVPVKRGQVDRTGTPITYPPGGGAGPDTGQDLDLRPRIRNNNIGFIWKGYINVPNAGMWTFYTASDDGSIMDIGPAGSQQRVVSNDYAQGVTERSGQVALAAGKHGVTIKFANGGGDFNVGVAWELPTVVTKAAIPNSAFTQDIMAPAPTINPTVSLVPISVSMSTTVAAPGTSIRYTLDGTDPDGTSLLYGGPVLVNTGNTTLKAITYNAGYTYFQIASGFYDDTRPPDDSTGAVPGVYYTRFEGWNGNGTVPTPAQYDAYFPSMYGIATTFDSTPVGEPGPDNFAMRFTGFLHVPGTGLYTFEVGADDGCLLYIGTRLVVDHNGAHPVIPLKTGYIGLDAGDHAVTVYYTNAPASRGLTLYFDGPGIGGMRQIMNDFWSTDLFTWPMVNPIGLSPAPGNFTGSVNVTMDCTTPGATIFYSTDGTNPSLTSATGVYVNPVTLTDTTKINAVAVGGAKTNPSYVSGTYTRTDAPPKLLSVVASGFNTQILVFFDSDMQAASANTPGNYTVGGGPGVTGAALDGTDLKLVRLTVAPNMDAATQYSLTVQNVQSAGGGTIVTVTMPFRFFGPNQITREYFDNVFGGDRLVNLTGSAAFIADDPTSVNFPNLFEGPVNFDDDYGTRMRGFFYPMVTNQYTFSLATDDDGQFYLSTNPNPANKGAALLNLVGAVGSRNFGDGPDANTGNLVAGQRYYVEALHKEGVGGDNIAVRGEVLGSTMNNGDAPIDGGRLSPYIDPVRIVTQPISKVVVAGNAVTFAITAAGTGPKTYQWYKVGLGAIGGATATMYTIPSAVPGDAGQYYATVTSAQSGTAQSLNATLMVIDPASPPTVTGIVPTDGPGAGGQAVTVSGTNFLAGQTNVALGGVRCTNVVVTGPGTLTAVTGAYPSGGVVDVVVTVFGQFSGTLANGYNYWVAPTITAVAPVRGPEVGGQTVTITGTGFLNVPGSTTVTFDATAVAGTWVDATHVTAVCPAHAPGTVNVAVTTPGGAATLNACYTYVATPTTATIAAVQGPLNGGQTVTITGTNFETGAGVTTVTICGVAATGVNVTAANSLTAVTGVGVAGQGNVVVTTFGLQSGTLNNGYTYMGLPTVTGIVPNQGPDTGGQSVTITGTNFPQLANGNTIGVTLVGTAVTSVDSVNPAGTQITATTAAAPAGTGTVVVTTFTNIPASSQVSNAFNSYTYRPAPTITSYTPLMGPATGGTLPAHDVVITGTNFVAGSTTVDFGGVAGTIVGAVTATQITVTPPASVPANTTGAVNLTVTVASVGSVNAATQYMYYAAPVVTVLTPQSGTTLGGYTTVITGDNFPSDPSFIGVTIGGNNATGITYTDQQHITATVPGGLGDPVNVVVTTFGTQSQTLLNGFHYNDWPVAVSPTPPAVTVAEDGSVVITLSSTDAESYTQLTYAISTLPTNGALSPITLGPVGYPRTATVTYTPAANWNGNDSFQFTVTDQYSASLPATVNITVTPVNDTPLANAQAGLTTAEDTPLAITLTGDDGDPNAWENQALTYAISTPAANGTVTVNPATGAATYTPNLNYNGPDSFQFTVTDDGTAGPVANLTSAPAVVSLNVTPVNDAPVAANGTLTTNEDTAANGALSATDVEGDALTYSIVTNGTLGTAVITDAATGAYTYTPNVNANGTDTFTFLVNDGALDSNTATVTVTVVPVNDPPLAIGQPVSTPESTALQIGLLADDGDPEVVQGLTFVIVTPPAHGTLSGLDPATGQVLYTPEQYYNGPDSFTFTVTDDGSAGALANLTSAPATVAITIGAVNNAPVAIAQSLVTGINTPLTIVLSATDVDSTNLTYAIATQPAHGTLAGGPAISTYTPASGFVGTDTFTFTASDGLLTSVPATITILVTPPPTFASAPVLSPDPVVAGQPVYGLAAAGAASISWNFGDGTQAAGGSVTHTYTQPGVYTVTVTATSPEGITTVYQTDVFVGMMLSGPSPTGIMGGAALPPGATGILVGGAGIGQEAGGSGKVLCNYVRRERTWIAGSAGTIAFPATLQQVQLMGQPGVLTLGRGPTAQSFVFTLNKGGRGRATGVQVIEVNLKKQRFKFKVNQRPELTATLEALGGTWIRETKRGPVVMMYVPATLQVGNSIFLAFTFQMEYRQIGDMGKGGLTR